VRLLHPRVPVYVVPRADGLFMVGATMIESDQGTRISARSMLELLSAAYALHPAFGEAEIVEIGTARAGGAFCRQPAAPAPPRRDAACERPVSARLPAARRHSPVARPT